MIVQFFDGRADILLQDGSVDVDCAVAQGATVMAEVLSGRLQSNFIMQDVAPLSLGTDMLVAKKQGWIKSLFCNPEYECISDIIIARNTSIPCDATRKYRTTYDNQDMIRVLVLEGESRLAKDCHMVKEVRIGNLTPQRAGQVEVTLKFKIDENNLLKVSLSETGNPRNTVIKQIDLQTHNLSQEKIEELVASAQVRRSQNQY